jgi:xanthine dehydrogenase accessory factor
MASASPLVLLRGGGDLASGVAARLWRSGFWVVVTEIAQPLAVRRLVALAEAIYAGQVQVEDIRATRTDDTDGAFDALKSGTIPVLVDPKASGRTALRPDAIVDARMAKVAPDLEITAAPLVIGLGPGFDAGVNCHAVIETNRGHSMGRVIWSGSAEPDTGVPDPVRGQTVDRVLRAPATGVFEPVVEIGSKIEEGALLAKVDGEEMQAPFNGALRGLLHWGVPVHPGMKVGDLDPRNDPELCRLISDKSLAVGGGVLEALLSRDEIRAQLAH